MVKGKGNNILDIAIEVSKDDYISSQDIINDEKIGTREKINGLLNIKNNLTNRLLAEGELDELSNSFYVDGSIKISSSDLGDNFIDVGEKLKDFTMLKGNNIVFRGEKYYFLFDSLNVGGLTNFGSVNDFEIDNINIENFVLDIKKHYLNINKSIKYFLNSTDINDLSKRKIILGLIDTRINIFSFFENITEIISNENFLNPDYEGSLVFDQDTVKEIRDSFWNISFSEIDDEELNQNIGIKNINNKKIVKKKNKFLRGNNLFIKNNKSLKKLNKKVDHIIGGDISGIYNVLRDRSMLDNDYYDNIVNDDKFKDKKNDHNYVQKKLKSFGVSSKDITNVKKPLDRLGEALSVNGDYYTRLLLGDLDVLQEMGADNTYNGLFVPIEFKLVGEKLVDTFNLINKYDDLKENGDNTFGYNQKLLANKIIRLYREENDPLVMIKTALNSYNSIISKGFNPDTDNLEIFSVNYGGSVIGSYINPIFNLLLNNGGIGADNGNLVYSKYDLKNNNKKLGFFNYPISIDKKRVIDHIQNIIGGNYKEGLSRDFEKSLNGKNNYNNWALIYDDNSQTGKTLLELKTMLKKEGIFDHIETFACRVISNIGRISAKYGDKGRLELLSNAGTISRRSGLPFIEGKRYNESISRIVGRNLYKDKLKNK